MTWESVVQRGCKDLTRCTLNSRLCRFGRSWGRACADRPPVCVDTLSDRKAGLLSVSWSSSCYELKTAASPHAWCSERNCKSARVPVERFAEWNTCCACPSESVCVPRRDKHTRPAFKKAYDLLCGNLQLLRDFRRRKVFRQFGDAGRRSRFSLGLGLEQLFGWLA
jgi:hypothetical protein